MKTLNCIKIGAGLLCLGLLLGAPSMSMAESSVKDAVKGIGDATQKAAANTSEYLSDSWITTQIKTKFLEEKGLKSMDLSVVTKDGVVTLTGEVNTEPERFMAERLAGDVEGVKKVESKITVK